MNANTFFTDARDYNPKGEDVATAIRMCLEEIYSDKSEWASRSNGYAIRVAADNNKNAAVINWLLTKP